MKRLKEFLLLIIILGIFSSCEQCGSYLERPLSESYFRLFDDLGNDLWFGPSKPFIADSADVFVVNQGTRMQLETRVQSNASSTRYVAFTLPATPGEQAKTILHLSETDSLVFFYLTVTDQENCEEFEEISFILSGDSLICSRCGLPQIEGGSGEFIGLVY
jgi:hypothetical protein